MKLDDAASNVVHALDSQGRVCCGAEISDPSGPGDIEDVTCPMCLARTYAAVDRKGEPPPTGVRPGAPIPWTELVGRKRPKE